MLQYTVTPVSPQAHLFRVDLLIPDPDPVGQCLTLPAWIPGSYMIRDFAKNIVTLQAVSDGQPLAVTKTDKQTWLCAPCRGELRVSYQVYAWDLSVRGAHLDTTHGYFNGTSLFLAVVGQEEDACRIDIRPPQAKYAESWRVATTLPRAGAPLLGFGLYQAGSYDELIDHPVEMGDFTRAKFEVAGTPHEIIISGRHAADMARICVDLEAICAQQVALFGELPEMERYLFMVMAVGDGYGGLEHRSSTSLICKRSDLPQVGAEKITEGYRQFLGLCSHEYFHLWNVKRIRPRVYMESGLSSEVYTRLLWVFEGFTSYYDDLMLRRSGRIDDQGYLELLAQVITRYYRGSGRFKQSVTDSSFDAWTKFYKQDENAPNAIVSYYTKGALIALALDLLLRQRSSGSCSLDQVMQALWAQHGRPGIGVPEDGVQTLISELSGQDLEDFFEQALYSCQDLDLAHYLSTVGIGFGLRSAKDASDMGGVRKAGNDTPKKSVLGVRLQPGSGHPVLSHVLDGGAAQEAGLSAHDEIVAVGGIKATNASLDDLLNRLPEGQSVEILAFRRDELMPFEVALRPAPDDTCELWLIEGAGEVECAARDAWLAPIAD